MDEDTLGGQPALEQGCGYQVRPDSSTQVASSVPPASLNPVRREIEVGQKLGVQTVQHRYQILPQELARSGPLKWPFSVALLLRSHTRRGRTSRTYMEDLWPRNVAL